MLWISYFTFTIVPLISINGSCIASYQCVGNATCNGPNYLCSCGIGSFYDSTNGYCGKAYLLFNNIRDEKIMIVLYCMHWVQF